MRLFMFTGKHPWVESQEALKYTNPLYFKQTGGHNCLWHEPIKTFYNESGSHLFICVPLQIKLLCRVQEACSPSRCFCCFSIKPYKIFTEHLIHRAYVWPFRWNCDLVWIFIYSSGLVRFLHRETSWSSSEEIITATEVGGITCNTV